MRIALLLLFVAGCASTSPRDAFDDVKKMTNAHPRWDENAWEDDETGRAIDHLIDQELTADAAVEVALLASPRLKQTFEELSIAQADLVQAGLLKNPVLTVGTTAWESEHIDPNLFVSVEQDFLDIVTLPLRKRVAGAELEARKLQVADEVLELAAEVRTAYYTAVAARQQLEVRKLLEEAGDLSAELAKKQHEAGNISDLSLGQELALASETRLARIDAENEATQSRERLTKALGLWGPRVRFKTPSRLPDLPKQDPAMDLEKTAMEHRLDIAAARSQVVALDRSLTLAKTTRWTGTVTAGLQVGRLRGSKRLGFGPQVSIEIPLFDQRRGAIAKLEAMKRQAEEHQQELAIDARSDVRAADARVKNRRALVDEYASKVVPLREQNVKLGQQEHDAMLIGLYQLVALKQAQWDAYRNQIEATRDYWIARADLDRATGTRLPGAP